MNIRTAVVLSFVSFSPVLASAQVVIPPNQLVARHSGKCAAIETTRQGASVVQRACDGSRVDQQWRVQPASNGQVQLVSLATNACLDVEGAAATEGARIVQNACKTASNLSQLWMVRSTRSGSQLMAVHSQRCLNVAGSDSGDGARFVQGDCGDKPNQLFDLRAVSSASSAVASAEPFVGEWRWFNGVTITVKADGSIQGTNGQKGTWVREQGSRYVVTWQEGWVDRLLLAEDGRRVQGSNQNGTQVSGERVGNPVPTPVIDNSQREHHGIPMIGGEARTHGVKRDCGTGDDPGCDTKRNGELPMDAAAFGSVMTGLKSTPAEPTRVTLVKSLVGTKLLTALQLGVVIDSFKSEPQALEAVRVVAKNVVDPANMGALTAKFHGMPNKQAYAKIVESVQPNARLGGGEAQPQEQKQQSTIRMEGRRR